MAMTRQRSVGNMMMRPSASYTESLALSRARSSGMTTTMMLGMHSASCTDQQRARPTAAGVFAEEMLTPAESFSELSRMGSVQAAVKMSLEEMARIEEEQSFIEREMEKGVVYILGEAEVVARPHSSLLKKVMVNYAYAFLRKNCRQGEKMLAIPKSQLLKVGMTYEI
ncbi:potassium transporter 22-like [Panicum miliaceum]|uniref:Potassium transporter 22-like n=1 Tax=Panicum miliaceum TaxID=4540 RepID=A0A3L6TGD7_PANMI|nr:potassium transporter 22-like [Panicum miliaceum]